MFKMLLSILALVSVAQISQAQEVPVGAKRKPYLYCRANRGYFPELKVDIVLKTGRPYALAGTAVEAFTANSPRNVKFGGLLAGAENTWAGMRYTFRESNYSFLDGARRKLGTIVVGNAQWGAAPKVTIELDGRAYDVLGCTVKN